MESKRRGDSLLVFHSLHWGISTLMRDLLLNCLTERTTTNGHIRPLWPLMELEDWDILMQLFMNSLKVTLNILNGRQGTY